MSKSKKNRERRSLKKRSKSLVASQNSRLEFSARRLPRSLKELAALDNAEVASVDIARMNLLCAEGLPGSESINIENVLKSLDEWAKMVRFDTDRHFYKFQKIQ